MDQYRISLCRRTGTYADVGDRSEAKKDCSRKVTASSTYGFGHYHFTLYTVCKPVVETDILFDGPGSSILVKYLTTFVSILSGYCQSGIAVALVFLSLFSL